MSMAATPDKKTVVRELMELGKQKGQLTNQDILDAIGEIDFDPEQLEKLYDSFAQLGIRAILKLTISTLALMKAKTATHTLRLQKQAAFRLTIP